MLATLRRAIMGDIAAYVSYMSRWLRRTGAQYIMSSYDRIAETVMPRFDCRWLELRIISTAWLGFQVVHELLDV